MTTLAPITFNSYFGGGIYFDIAAPEDPGPLNGANDPFGSTATPRIVPFDIASDWSTSPLSFDAFSQPAQGIPLGNGVTVVPEPGTLALLALGAGYLALASRRRFKR